MWQLRESAHAVLTDEGGAILDEHTGRWAHLTPTAAAAVMLLLASTTEDQAAEQYAARYSIGTDQATTDVRTVAHALTTQGLVVTEPVNRRRWWGRWR